MIPYDELVVALQTWRARKGLPVAQLSGALTPPPVVTAPVAAPRPGSGPQRAAPPTPPRPATPPPLAPTTMDETLDEDALLVDAALDAHLGGHIDESHYENDGDNFSIPFDARAAALAAGEDVEESTSIGAPPGRPSDMDTTNPHGDPVASRGTKRSDDW